MNENPKRISQIKRQTKETNIEISLNLDGLGKSKIQTGIGFLDHMLISFSKHSRFDLEINCQGDIFIDDHHSTEDIGIALGEAFLKALGDKKGITRFGNMFMPMDEALLFSAVDISGRSYLNYEVQIPSQKVGSFDTELVEEFWLGFIRKAELTLHIRQIAGKNSHHIIEALFKSVAISLKQAVLIDEKFKNDLPSTKGLL